MSDELKKAGLECFAQGDVAGAMRLWLQALLAAPKDPQVLAYMEHVRQVAPEVAFAVEAERRAQPTPELPRATALAPPLPPVVEFEVPAMPEPELLPPEEDPTIPVLNAARVAALPFDPEPRTPPLVVAPPAPAPSLASPSPPVSQPIAGPPPAAPPAAVTAIRIEMPPAPAPVLEMDPSDPWAGSGDPAVQVASSASGLGLVDQPPPPAPPPATKPFDLASQLARLRKLRELDDFSGALEVATGILAVMPDSGEAQTAVRECKERLTKIYESKIGSTRAVPLVRLPPGEVIWLDLDHRAGFVLAQVDGVSSYEEIIEVTGMERVESLKILAQLVQNGVIAP